MSLLATMPLSPLLTAVIETTLNTLINDDPALGRKLLRLKGKVISLHLRVKSIPDLCVQSAHRCDDLL